MDVKLDHKNKVAPIGRVESVSRVSADSPLFPVLVLREGGSGKRERRRRGEGEMRLCICVFFFWFLVLCQIEQAKSSSEYFSKFQNL